MICYGMIIIRSAFCLFNSCCLLNRSNTHLDRNDVRRRDRSLDRSIDSSGIDMNISCLAWSMYSSENNAVTSLLETVKSTLSILVILACLTRMITIYLIISLTDQMDLPNYACFEFRLIIIKYLLFNIYI